jgi:hypothetical protein
MGTYKVGNSHCLESHALQTTFAQLIFSRRLRPRCPLSNLIKARLNHRIGINHFAFRVEVIQVSALGILRLLRFEQGVVDPRFDLARSRRHPVDVRLGLLGLLVKYSADLGDLSGGFVLGK